MNDERLYIDDELVDIDGNTKITMDIKSNLFRDVSQIASNSTYTVRLPKTVRNQKLLQHSDLVQERGNFAYMMHTARYFRNGVEIIKNGRLTVLQVTDTAIEVCIVWGLYPAFSKLINNGTMLNQLQSNDKILFKNSNEVNSYEEALKANYFYANYDVWKHDNKVDYTWRSGSGMTFPLSEKINLNQATMVFGGSRKNDIEKGVGHLHPVVKASYILELIKKQTEIDFSFSGSAKEYIDTLIIPLIGKKSNELTFDGHFVANMQPTTSKGAVTLNVHEGSNVFAAGAGSNETILNIRSDANVIIDVHGEWQFDITGARASGHVSSHFGNETSRSYDNYNFNSMYYLNMTITNGIEKAEYIIGSTRELIQLPSGYQGVCKFEYAAKGKVEVKAGGTIKFEWLSDGTLKDAQFLGGTIKATLSSDEYVPSGGYFPIAYNLPKIKIIEFVKFLAAVTGTFPLQMNRDKIVEFVPLSTVWNNRHKAQDWTRKVITQGAENKPKTIDFKISDYAQHNRYKWKADDTVIGDYNGDLIINNDTLESEKVIYEFPFAATDGNNVPMYTAPDISNTTSTGKEAKEASYNACKDRVLRLAKDRDGKAIAVFDINMQDILKDKYQHIVSSLQTAKVITEKMCIRDLELIDFDETRPIYLAQYGSYFAVTEIKAEDRGIAEVTMFQLNME